MIYHFFTKVKNNLSKFINKTRHFKLNKKSKKKKKLKTDFRSVGLEPQPLHDLAL